MTQAELARAVGTKQQTISYICAAEHEATASRYTIKIAELFGVNPNWLATGEGNPQDATLLMRTNGSPHKLHPIPIYRGHDAALRFMRGESQEPTGYLLSDRGTPGKCWVDEISDPSRSGATGVAMGDHLIFDTASTPRPSDNVVVMLNKDLLMMGTYRLRGQGFEVVPLNPDFDTVHSGKNVQIVGVLIERRLYGSLPK